MTKAFIELEVVPNELMYKLFSSSKRILTPLEHVEYFTAENGETQYHDKVKLKRYSKPVRIISRNARQDAMRDRFKEIGVNLVNVAAAKKTLTINPLAVAEVSSIQMGLKPDKPAVIIFHSGAEVQTVSNSGTGSNFGTLLDKLTYKQALAVPYLR